MPQIITPPIRTALLTQNGVPFGTENGDIQTTRDWWLYWNRLGDAANLTGLQTSEGAHSDRPVPGGMPDGAIFVESDRGVIYQVQAGDWVYVAGIMYGTISPDERPTDLGPNDSGFAFTATDPLASDTGRTFVWSGAAWVETSEVLYGTHANRPLPAAAPARCIYVEADRGPTFQNQLGQWVYLAGTMWGTLSPDQRPTDLGMFDAGFVFRTNVAPAREFIWSGTAWVEIAPVMYGTHAARPASGVAPANALYVEGDRGPIFQNQLGHWVYIAGIMWGTISPDQRPTDLGVYDAGFTFRTNVAPAREFIWNQTAWVETTPQSNTVQIAYCSGGLTLTTSAQNVPGCSLTLAAAGQYLIHGVFDFNSNDANVYLTGTMNGATNQALYMSTTTGGRATVAQQWTMTASAGSVAQLTAQKSGGTGFSAVEVHSSISAVWIAP